MDVYTGVSKCVSDSLCQVHTYTCLYVLMLYQATVAKLCLLTRLVWYAFGVLPWKALRKSELKHSLQNGRCTQCRENAWAQERRAKCVECRQEVDASHFRKNADWSVPASIRCRDCCEKLEAKQYTKSRRAKCLGCQQELEASRVRKNTNWSVPTSIRCRERRHKDTLRQLSLLGFVGIVIYVH